MPKRKKKNKAGRKPWDGKSEKIVLAKLERCFAAGCPDHEACLYAGISPATLYRFEQRNPAFRERKEALKNTPLLRARLNIASLVGQRTPDGRFTARWYLERKAKDEFSTRQEIGGKGGGPVSVRDERVEKLYSRIEAMLQGQRRPTAAAAAAAG